jgi:hypothetical protein
MYAGLPSRRRGRRRLHVRHRVRHVISRNPLKASLGTFKQLFNKEFLVDAATISAGAIGTGFVTGYVLNKLGKSAWATGIPGYASNIVVAGALGAVASMLGKPRIARNIMLGGVALVIGQAVNAYLMPALGQPAGATLTGLGADNEIRSLVSNEVRGYLSGGMGAFLSPGKNVMSGYAHAGSPVLSGMDIETF